MQALKLEAATIGVALTVMLTIGGAIWQVSQRDTILSDHEKRITKIEASIADRPARVALQDNMEQRVKSLEAIVSKQSDTTNAMAETLARIDERLKFLIDQFGKGGTLPRIKQ